MFIEAAENNISVLDLVEKINIGEETFKFLLATIYSSGHFRAVLFFENQYYLIDDLYQSCEPINEVNLLEYNFTLCVYYKENFY